MPAANTLRFTIPAAPFKVTQFKVNRENILQLCSYLLLNFLSRLKFFSFEMVVRFVKKTKLYRSALSW